MGALRNEETRGKVVRRDLRGHGHSSSPKPPDNYDYLLETILTEFIDCFDQLGLEKVHFMGELTSGMLGGVGRKVSTTTALADATLLAILPYLSPAALQFFTLGHKDWPTACREMGSGVWAEALSKSPGTLPSTDPKYCTFNGGWIGWRFPAEKIWQAALHFCRT